MVDQNIDDQETMDFDEESFLFGFAVTSEMLCTGADFETARAKISQEFREEREFQKRIREYDCCQRSNNP